MDITLSVQFGTAALGAVAQEVVYWYDIKTKLAAAKYQHLMRSPIYWLVTSAMIVVAALGTVAWFYGDKETPRTYLLMGAAFPLAFKKLVSAFTARNRLGSDEIHAYFREQ